MRTILALIICFPSFVYAQSSICFGTTSNGILENGVELPEKGSNFTSYSSIARLLSRTYVHSSVKEIIINSYKALETENSDKIYKYAETGFKEGGSLNLIKHIRMVYP